MIKRIHVRIAGTVQMVSFRYYTKYEADLLGLNGWVKNNPDGSVEAVFEGEEDKIKKITEFCKKGPSSATIESTDIKEETPENINGFGIRFW